MTCAFYGYPFYLLFVFISHYLLVLLNTFYADSLFGCLKIYSSQLVLISTAFYKLPFRH